MRASGIAVGKWIAPSAANVDRSERPNLARSEHPGLYAVYMHVSSTLAARGASGEVSNHIAEKRIIRVGHCRVKNRLIVFCYILRVCALEWPFHMYYF